MPSEEGPVVTAEAIARVVRDLRRANFVAPAPANRDIVQQLVETGANEIGIIVDATPMFRQLAEGDEIDLYDDFVVMPVWDEAIVGYVNSYGNVLVAVSFWKPVDKVEKWEPTGVEHGGFPARPVDDPIEWDRVARVHFLFVFVGGRVGSGEPVRTVGPVMMFRVAVTDDGELVDVNWMRLANAFQSMSDNILLVWLQTFTLATCVNVELVEPTRDRPARRRLDRIGVGPVTEIVIRRMSRSTRSDNRRDGDGDVPQSFVRGHYARYGPEFDRKLLFGKYAGKFWIPAHARGTIEREGGSTYRVEP